MSLWLQVICACANLKHAANSWFMKTEGLAQNSGRLWNYGIARSDRGGKYLVSCALLCIIVSSVDPVFVILTKNIVFVKYQTLSADKIKSNICKFRSQYVYFAHSLISTTALPIIQIWSFCTFDKLWSWPMHSLSNLSLTQFIKLNWLRVMQTFSIFCSTGACIAAIIAFLCNHWNWADQWGQGNL